jgi:hypothetical protein
MTTATLEREEILQKIRDLPDDKLPDVLGFVEALQEEDDEPLTEEELEAIAQAEEDIAAGNFCTLEEFNREMDELDVLL